MQLCKGGKLVEVYLVCVGGLPSGLFAGFVTVGGGANDKLTGLSG